MSPQDKNIARELDRSSLVQVPEYQEGAHRWCTGSLSFPNATPPQDSNGDCVECGEKLIWVIPISLLDTSNDFFVGTNGDTISIMRPPHEMTKEQALRLAAWLSILADPLDERFPAVRKAISNT